MIKKTRVKDTKARQIIDLRPLQQTITILSQTPARIITFEAYFLLLQLLVILASMDFPSVWQSEHFRIYVYSTMILLLGFVKRFKFDFSHIDPLGISKWTWIVNMFDLLLQVNTFYLLARMLAEIPFSHSAGVILHCFYSTYKHIDMSKKLPKFKYRSVKPSGLKIAQPIALFVLCKVVSREFNQTSLVFLVFSLFNILMFLEIGNALYFKSFMLTFWHKRFCQIEENKRCSLRSRKLIIKNLLVLCALAIAAQNLLAILQKLRYEISWSLIQTLIVGGYGYYQYTGLEPCESKYPVQN